MEQQYAFQVGEFLGSALIFVLIALVFLKIFLILRNKVDKKGDTNDSGEKIAKRSSKLDKILMIIIIVIVAIMALSVITYVSYTPAQPKIDSKDWTDILKSDFKKGVLKTCKNGETEYCTCLADYFIKNYTYDEVYKIYAEAKKTNSTPKAINDGARACASTLNAGSQ